MEKTATPQAKPKNKHFWNFQPASGENPPELILYGDIASETWWGDEVTPRQFTEELDALGAVPEIVVRINSGGGDVFAANAIYTRLKDNAAKITVKIDGWAASAATIIAMAGDSIEIPGNGVFMVHDPALGLLGYIPCEELGQRACHRRFPRAGCRAYQARRNKDFEANPFQPCNAGRKAVRKRYGFPEICRRRGLDLSANPGGAETAFHVQRY